MSAGEGEDFTKRRYRAAITEIRMAGTAARTFPSATGTRYAARLRRRFMIEPGDVVTLRAGCDPLLVLKTVKACDGTGGDGAGLLCWWFDDAGMPALGWVSESSVVPTGVRHVAVGEMLLDLLPREEP